MRYPFYKKQEISVGFLQEYPKWLQDQLRMKGVKDWKYHTGYDFKTEMGLPVMAMEHGIVQFDDDLDDKDGIGVAIVGDSGRCRYWHLDSNLVKQGDKVKEGQVIGFAGDSGLSFGAHTHIDLYNNGWVDYIKLIPKEEQTMPTPKEKNYDEVVKSARSHARKLGWSDWKTRSGNPLMIALFDHADAKDKEVQALENDKNKVHLVRIVE